MRVISPKALKLFGTKHPDAAGPLAGWLKVTRKAEWKNFAEVRQSFNSADVVGIYTVFDIKGNSYRLITVIHYNTKKVFVRHMFTHPDYDRWNGE